MSIYDRVRAKQKTERGENTQEENKVAGPTIEQIRQNPENDRLFSLYLQQAGAIELAARWHGKDLGDHDLLDLAEKRDGFLQTMDRSKRIEKAVNKNSVQEMIEASPELAEIAKLMGPDRIATAVKNRLPEKVILDQGRFESLDGILMDLEKSRAAEAESEKKIEQICKRYKVEISKEEYQDAIYSSNSKKALEELISSRMSRWMRFYKKHISHEFVTEVAQADRRIEIDGLVKKTDADLQEVAEMLRLTLLNNKTTREGFSAILAGEAPTQGEPIVGSAEMNANIENDSKEHPISHSELDEMRQEYVSKYPGMSEDDVDANVATQYTRKNLGKKKRGAFGFLAELFYSRAVLGELLGMKQQGKQP